MGRRGLHTAFELMRSKEGQSWSWTLVVGFYCLLPLARLLTTVSARVPRTTALAWPVRLIATPRRHVLDLHPGQSPLMAHCRKVREIIEIRRCLANEVYLRREPNYSHPAALLIEPSVR
jgi:hypothetical protein